MKKLLTLMLAMGLCITAVSCSSDADGNTSAGKQSGEKTELTCVFPSFASQEEEFKDALKEFDKEDLGITITPTYVTASAWNDFFTKIQTMAASGKAPDLMRITNEGAQMVADMGLALPLEDYMANEDPEMLNDIDANLMQAYDVDDHQYAYAYEWNNCIVYLNTALMEEAGLEFPEADWTQDQFLEYAKVMTTEKNGQKIYGCVVPDSYFIFSGWLFNNDTSVLNEDMTKSNLLDPKVKEVVQFFYDCIYKYEVAPVPETGMDYFVLMANNQIGMGYAGRWSVQTFENSGFTDYNIQKLPKIQKQVTIYGGGAFVVSKTTKHPDEAYKAATWFNTSDYSQVELLGASAIPSRRSIMEEVLANDIPENNKLFMDTENAKPVEAPPQYSEISLIVEKYIKAIFTNEMGIDDGLAAADQEVNAALSR